jgi:hypothetical protein
VLINPKRWDAAKDLSNGLRRRRKRLHHNVLTVALARMAWAVFHKDRDFECEKTEMAPRCA